jgi:Ser/Thr protein kinase RdoA (MazF antagonist)
MTNQTDGIRAEAPAEAPAEALAEALQRFGMEALENLGGFSSQVYECQRDQQRCILKLIDSDRISQSEIEGELDFVFFLADHGIPVARPLPSRHNRYIEVIEQPAAVPILAHASEKARGEVLPDEDEIPLPGARLDHLLVEWGKLTGKLHHLTKNYHPKSPETKRIEWNEEDTVWNVEKHIPSGQPLVRAKVNALFRKFATLPKNEDTYGLIHCDLHQAISR